MVPMRATCQMSSVGRELGTFGILGYRIVHAATQRMPTLIADDCSIRLMTSKVYRLKEVDAR